MAERSTFPLYGNVFTFYLNDNTLRSNPPDRVSKKYFEEPMMALSSKRGNYTITRNESHPIFNFRKSDKRFSYQQIPFPTDRLYHDQLLLLSDTLKISKDKFSKFLSLYLFKHSYEKYEKK